MPVFETFLISLSGMTPHSDPVACITPEGAANAAMVGAKSSSNDRQHLDVGGSSRCLGGARPAEKGS